MLGAFTSAAAAMTYLLGCVVLFLTLTPCNNVGTVHDKFRKLHEIERIWVPWDTPAPPKSATDITM